MVSRAAYSCTQSLVFSYFPSIFEGKRKENLKKEQEQEADYIGSKQKLLR